MRKSNWIIFAILVIASIVFLCLWHFLKFDLIHGLDLILSIIWWVLVIVACIVVHMVDERRRRALRTAFLAKGIIYNPEAGIVKVSPDEDVVDVLYGILENLDYATSKPDTEDNKRIRFDYIIHSDKFSPKRSVWEGEVLDIIHGGKTISFSGREELSLELGIDAKPPAEDAASSAS